MNCKGDCKDIEKTVTLDLFCKTKCVHCRSVTKRSRNIVLSVNNLRFRLLHIFQNQNMRICEEKWMKPMPVYFSKENTMMAFASKV